jgi:DNA polymerase-3 subunit gamma/tau
MNAMLDMIEKAPSHVYFILTTTDPQKLILPLRKRCVEYNVLPLSDDEMFDLLADVCDAEGKNVPDDILEKIIQVAGGSSRNALQVLETVIDLAPKDMAKAALRLEDEETTTKALIDALLKKKKWKDVAAILKNLTAEPESIRYAILGYCNAILMSGKDDKQVALVMACFGKNTYDTGRSGITLAAYDVLCG